MIEPSLFLVIADASIVPWNIVPTTAVLLKTKTLGVYVLHPTMRIAHLAPIWSFGIVTVVVVVSCMVEHPKRPNTFEAIMFIVFFVTGVSTVSPRKWEE